MFYSNIFFVYLSPDHDVISLDKSRKFDAFYSLAIGLMGLALPFVALCWIYVKMYQTAQKNSRRTRRHSISASQKETVIPECPSTPESTNQNSVRSKTRISRKKSSNNSNLSSFFREEGRAVKTGVIVTVSYLVSWMPFYCYKIVESTMCHHPYVEDFVALLALSTSCTMPFIYVYRNDTARKEAIKIICWWRTFNSFDMPYLRDPPINRLINGNSEVPVRIIEPDDASLYSYAAECRECGASQLVSAMKPCPPPSPCDPISRVTGMPRRQSTVSFKLSPMDKPGIRCRQCLRQDSASSASSEDPLLLDRWRYPRHSATSVRWNRQRLSNGSVTTRSNSLASTNSSVLSYSVQRCPARRFSAVSTDSGVTVLKKSLTEESDDALSDITLRRFSCQRPLFTEDPMNISEVDESIEFHGYNNPFRENGMSFQPREVSISPTKIIFESGDVDIHRKYSHDSKSGYSQYNSRQLSPNIDRLQIPTEHGRVMREHLCQIHPQGGLDYFKNLAKPEKMSIDGSPELSSPKNKKLLQRTKSNPKFLRVSMAENRQPNLSNRLERGGLEIKSDSNLNDGSQERLRETYSAE